MNKGNYKHAFKKNCSVVMETMERQLEIRLCILALYPTRRWV